VHIDQNATIGHDTTIGAFSRLNPQACVSGSVKIADGVLVGASATVLQGLSVAARATVGAGSVVVRDVAADSTVKGVPAK
jgi:serine acetyltransferase